VAKNETEPNGTELKGRREEKAPGDRDSDEGERRSTASQMSGFSGTRLLTLSAFINFAHDTADS